MRRLADTLPIALLCAACSSDPGLPSPRVVHLDPALADGRSPAEVLAAKRRTVAEWTVRSTETCGADLGSWSLANAELKRSTSGPGVTVLGENPVLSFTDTLQADSFNVVEVDVVYTGREKSATLIWRSDANLPGVDAFERSLVVPVAPTLSRQTLRFAAAAQPGWTGLIRSMEIRPVHPENRHPFELRGIRLVDEGFSPGVLAGPGGDGGLLGIDGDLRRAWPSDEGVPLYARARVPRGGRVSVETALVGSRLDAGASACRFAIDARVAGGAWETVAEDVRDSARSLAAARWKTLGGDLSAYAGQDTELRFRTFVEGSSDGTGGALERARFLWGRPIVLGEMPEDRPPNVLLVTVDTLRADALGCYGGPPVTPHLDALAEEGILFESAWSPSNATLPSHTTILTGLAVPAHGVLDNRSTLAGSVPTLAEALRAAGYQTAAAVSVSHLAAAYSGLGRGFDQYWNVDATTQWVDGGRTLSAVERWLEAWTSEGERPWFLWLHLFDPHTPYGPPAEFLDGFEAELSAAGRPVPARTAEPASIGPTPFSEPGRFLEGVTNVEYARHLYQAEVAYTDALVGDLLARLRSLELDDVTAVLLTADHGESLGEHGVWFGHSLLFPQSVHVPLILRVPGGPRGVRTNACVSGGDIARTVAELLDLPEFDPRGEDLLAVARAGEGAAGRRVWFVQAGLSQAGCRDDEVHYFQNLGEDNPRNLRFEVSANQDRFFFKHADDTGGFRHLGDDFPDDVARYSGAVDAWLERSATGVRLRPETSRFQEEALEALGYQGD